MYESNIPASTLINQFYNVSCGTKKWARREGEKNEAKYILFSLCIIYLLHGTLLLLLLFGIDFSHLKCCVCGLCAVLSIYLRFTPYKFRDCVCVFVDEYILSNRKSTTIVASTCLRFICWMLVTFDGTQQIQKIFQCWERVSIYIFVSHLFSSNFVWIDISTTEFIQFKLTLPRFIAWTLATRIHIVLTCVCLCSFECCWNVVNAYIWFAHSSKKKLTITYIMERETPSYQQRIHHIYNK